MVGPYLIISLALGHADYPINPALGVPGYPDCVQTNPGFNMVDTRVNEATLSCARSVRVALFQKSPKIAKNRPHLALPVTFHPYPFSPTFLPKRAARSSHASLAPNFFSLLASCLLSLFFLLSLLSILSLLTFVPRFDLIFDASLRPPARPRPVPLYLAAGPFPRVWVHLFAVVWGKQRPRDHFGQKQIAAVGDSITAGAFSSGGDHPYVHGRGSLCPALLVAPPLTNHHTHTHTHTHGGTGTHSSSTSC